MKKPIFRLSLLTMSLVAGFARADTPPEKAELPTVQVKAEATSSTRRITTKKIDETTATDMKEVLFNEPSVSFGGGNATSQWLTIRGMGQDQIDVKVDNTYSDSQIFHHNGRFLFDPELVKVVAVQKGTGSASAGIGATSGAIVAQTVNAKDLLRDGQNVGFKVGAGVSSNKGWNKNTSVYGRAGGFDALLAGNWVTERDYKPGKGYSSVTGDRINNSGLSQRGLLGKIGYSFNEDNRLSLSHRQERTYGERNLREEFDFAQRNNTANNNPRYRILTQDTTNLAYDGSNLGFISKINTNVYKKTDKREEPSDKGNATTKVETLGANLNLDSRLFDRHTLKYGINWRNQKTKPNEATRTVFVNEEKTDVGAYVEGIWDIHPVTLTTGLRYDHFDAEFSSGQSVSDGTLNPSVGLIYDVTPNFSLNSSLNYASRSPRLSEAALIGGRVYTVDSNLKAERSRNAEIGFNYRWNDALKLEGSYFDQKIKDVQAVQNRRYFNGGTLKNKGYELAANYQWRGFKARAGMAYNKPKINNTGIDSIMTFIPVGRTWTTDLSYQFDHPKLEIGWRGRFVQRTNHEAYQRGSGGGTARPGYGVNDIYANWKPTGKDNFNVNFAVNNVGNKYYKPHTQRESTNGNSLPEVGRDFRLSMNYRF
ncbi:TonB-dependent receptor plug domain-containing protein [Neisseria chenwenguii]|uniref:TonB-dependent receptor plug domain-containing protein n=1 Tax=Neisseria chenwenguii TaxID=1853278 RepID=UPI000F4E196D|nr:TonB-dependent receptor [Neisseria chenwenguii]ROV56696.1 TonB-dependent receptor [Neisseria chenwenguii]